LDWFYRILRLCEATPGELKSTEVWTKFQSLDLESRSRVRNGLSKVRIHIVDPRPYRKTFDEILRTVLPTKDALKYLREPLEANNPIGTWLSNQGQICMAGSILRDSVGARFHSLGKILANDGIVAFLGEAESGAEESVLSLSDFARDSKPLVRSVTTWSAKSAATFHEAIDCFQELHEEIRWGSTFIIRERMRSRVLQTHVFDEGNRRQLDLLENARQSILKHLRDPSGVVRGRQIQAYTEQNSATSYPVQAADLAAGIATKLMETAGLVSVVSAFEHVTYNGARMSVSDAEEAVRLMKS
jgi:hypothetical protein